MKLGSNECPAHVMVKSFDRADEIMDLCNEYGWKVFVAVKPDMPEDIIDIVELLKTHTYKHAYKAVGRNDLCPCGSNQKFENCCLD